MIDRVCEEFHCLPSQAERELDTNWERVMDVLFARNYARAHAAYNEAASLTPEARMKLIAEPMVRLVKDTDFMLAQEALNRG